MAALRLSPETWADGALDLISSDGLEALNVESLARHLGVTKGSFYWHFSSRAALLHVALARWERRQAETLNRDLAALSEPRARLRRLLWQGDDRVLARLAPAADPLVIGALQRLRERRLGYLVAAYTDLGLASEPAQRWALLAYAAHGGLDRLLPEDAARAVELLMPAP